MYSASYENSGENVPVESFTDPIIKQEFVKMINGEKAHNRTVQNTETQNFHEEPYVEQTQENVPELPQAAPVFSNTIGKHGYDKKEKSVFSFVNGFLKNIELEDIILAGLIFLFLKDDNKDNDIMIPVLLFILLAF